MLAATFKYSNNVFFLISIEHSFANLYFLQAVHKNVQVWQGNSGVSVTAAEL
jgi:hypothetical protein